MGRLIHVDLGPENFLKVTRYVMFNIEFSQRQKFQPFSHMKLPNPKGRNKTRHKIKVKTAVIK